MTSKTERPYVGPYCTPAECDHERDPSRDDEGEFGQLTCSRCCPCDECGAIRAEDQADD